MKKIEAVITRRNFPQIRDELSRIGIFIIDKRNLEDSNIYDESKGSRAGSTGIRTIPLSKVELVVANKHAKQVIELISKRSGLVANKGGRIFVSEMDEVVDMDTLEGKKDLEVQNEEKFELNPTIKKRSRFVPLQKFTLNKLQKMYDENKEVLKSDYRIRSFSDFVNYCIRKHLVTLEKQLKHPTIIYENEFGQV